MSNINVDNLTPLGGTSGKIGVSGSLLVTHITASGNISASGTIYADNFNSAGGDSAGISFTDDLIITGHITASGNISGSGTLDISGATNLDGALTVDGAGISLDSAGVAANFTVATDGAAEDLTIGLTGATDSSIVISSTGTGADAINIDTTAGSIDIDSADNITVGAADDISLTTTSADGLISLVSAHTAGDAVYIDANAHADSVVKIDAGVLDLNVTAAATLDAVGIALVAGSGELDLTTTGTMDINSAALDIDTSGAITIDAAGAASHIAITTAHTAGDAVHIDANANAGSIVNIDAGILDIDSDGVTTINAASTVHIGGATGATFGDDTEALAYDGSGNLDLDAVALDVDTSGAINITTAGAASDITLVTAHTAGVAFHLDADANAGSIVDIDAGILDIDVTGAATIDAASLTITGPITTVNGLQNAKLNATATDDGTSSGTIPAGTSVVNVACDGADKIIILPAPVVGNIIHLIETGTTGYELRTSTPASIGINGGTASNGESEIPGAITYIKCVCVSTTNWICSQFDADGDESKVEAAA